MAQDNPPAGLGLSEGLGPEQERRKVDEFDWHEAMDRASLFCNLVDTELLQLAAVQSDIAISAKVAAAAHSLAEAYQDIGRKRFAAGKAEPPIALQVDSLAAWS